MNAFLRNMRVVARRDFLAIVATPTFLLFLLAPLFMLAMGLAGGTGAAQLGVAALEGTPEGLVSHRLTTVEPVLVLPAAHPLAHVLGHDSVLGRKEAVPFAREVGRIAVGGGPRAVAQDGHC